MQKTHLDQSDCQMRSTALRPTRPPERAVHVLVPDEAYHPATLAAVASRLPFKMFMARLMLTARSVTAGESPATVLPITNMAAAGKPPADGDN